ncbi:MAG TPA: response regulator [Chloroflexota bacterium]|nr:response regulator [Chloroflexota bacterium]
MDDRCRSALVIEDDEDTRDVLIMLLTVLGLEVRQATNGQEALDALKTWRPDLIVLDLMMPVMNGWAFRSEQKRMPEARDIPVIVLSARQPPFRPEDELDVAELLPKPFELDTFLAAVARHCPGLAANAPSWLRPEAQTPEHVWVR